MQQMRTDRVQVSEPEPEPELELERKQRDSENIRRQGRKAEERQRKGREIRWNLLVLCPDEFVRACVSCDFPAKK
jgi:hypothetical protein